MDRDEIKQALDDVLDQAIVFHGFADYMRDYEVVVWATADPRTGIAPEHLVYTFKHCVRATVTSAVRPEPFVPPNAEQFAQMIAALAEIQRGQDIGAAT